MSGKVLRKGDLLSILGQGGLTASASRGLLEINESQRISGARRMAFFLEEACGAAKPGLLGLDLARMPVATPQLCTKCKNCHPRLLFRCGSAHGSLFLSLDCHRKHDNVRPWLQKSNNQTMLCKKSHLAFSSYAAAIWRNESLAIAVLELFFPVDKGDTHRGAELGRGHCTFVVSWI